MINEKRKLKPKLTILKIRIARGHYIFLYVDIAPKNSEWGRGEIVNSTWTSQFVFKNLISFQIITFRTHRKPIFDHKSS